MFHKNLKTWMVRKGVSAAQLSRLTGISPASLSQYISGKNLPPAQKIKQIADALEIRPDDLIKKLPDVQPVTDSKNQLFNLNVKVAAKLMGVCDDFVYNGLKNNTFPWGYAVKKPGCEKFEYFINSIKFAEIERVSIPFFNGNDTERQQEERGMRP